MNQGYETVKSLGTAVLMYIFNARQIKHHLWTLLYTFETIGLVG